MKVLFLVTEDWYFLSHRLPLAEAVLRQGHEVVLATRVREQGQTIAEAGIRVLPIKLRRRSKKPLQELLAILEILEIYRREKPDIVHHVSLKPVLYGSIAAWLARGPKVVNALAGLGFVFSSQRRLARLLRPFVKMAFRLLCNRPGSVVIVQNPDDRAVLLEEAGIAAQRVALIRGSGVPVDQYRVTPEPEGEPVIALVSRMLWDKGIGEYVAAVQRLRAGGLKFRALLVGIPDPENPASVPERQLRAWHEQGDIEWLGYVDDIPALWERSHLAVLPSYYGEGVPKSLIEAACCGRAIVSTDMPGCREIVRHGVNGLLVPAYDAEQLADAIAMLLEDPEKRRSMGAKGRELVQQEFSITRVNAETLALYEGLLQ